MTMKKQSVLGLVGVRAALCCLSGAALAACSDGSAGIMDVREAGGLVLAQSEESSRFDGMPRSAVETGCVDAVLAPEEMPAALVAYADAVQPGIGGL